MDVRDWTGAMSGKNFYGRSVCRLEGVRRQRVGGGRWTADGRKFLLLFRTPLQSFFSLLQRDADQTLLDLFPFAVDATLFRESYQSRVAIVRSELCKYLVNKAPPPLNRNDKVVFIALSRVCQRLKVKRAATKKF